MDVFVDIDNSIYAISPIIEYVQVWPVGNTNNTRTIGTNLNSSYSIFVTLNGDIYIDKGRYYRHIEKWTNNSMESVVVMDVTSTCFGLFIDSHENLYCSAHSANQVLKKSLRNTTRIPVVVAGTGTAGLAPNMLSAPRGIFVDNNSNLYVADSWNHRIQLFRAGQLNAITVSINGSNQNFTLNNPIDVVLDMNGYLFIADTYNHRILGSGPDGFRCIVGCTSQYGSASNELSHPRGLNFDSYGNLLVADANNSRVQKYFLIKNDCCKFYFIHFEGLFDRDFYPIDQTTTDFIAVSTVQTTQFQGLLDCLFG